MKRKAPALHNIGIDLDARALARFECDYPVQKIHGCAHRFLAECAFEGRELIYCDPPYLKHTCSSARRYRFDYEQGDHIELLEVLNALPLAQMLSLKRVQQSIKTLIDQAISEASIRKSVMRLHQALARWEQAAIEQILAHPATAERETRAGGKVRRPHSVGTTEAP